MTDFVLLIIEPTYTDFINTYLANNDLSKIYTNMLDRPNLSYKIFNIQYNYIICFGEIDNSIADLADLTIFIKPEICIFFDQQGEIASFPFFGQILKTKLNRQLIDEYVNILNKMSEITEKYNNERIRTLRMHLAKKYDINVMNELSERLFSIGL